MQKEKYTFDDLVHIMSALRDPESGCPWDLEQDHESLKPYLIEECYEALDAINEGPQALAEELGDVLLQIVFHAQLGKEAKTFTIDDVIQAISKKMVERHPHVFGEEQCETASEVLEEWEARKKKKPGRKSVLDGVPHSMPALTRAYRVGEKAATIGLEWDQIENVVKKLREEVDEFEAAVAKKEKKEIQEEFGDLLFTLAQIARKCEFEPEDTLRQSIEKFSKRLKFVEERVDNPESSVSHEDLEALWEQAKEQS